MGHHLLNQLLAHDWSTLWHSCTHFLIGIFGLGISIFGLWVIASAFSPRPSTTLRKPTKKIVVIKKGV